MTLLLLGVFFVCIQANSTFSPSSAPSLSSAPTTVSPSTTSPQSNAPTIFSSSEPTPSPTTSLPSTLAPSISSTNAPTNVPTTLTPSAAANSSALPLGFFQTACVPSGSIAWQRATIKITPPAVPGQANGFQYINELFQSSTCASFGAQVVSTASRIELNALSSTEAILDVFVAKVVVTLASPLLAAFFGGCDGGGWKVGVPRLLNHSCVVERVAIPAPSECPVFYSKIRYTNTTIRISDLYTLNGTNITCSASKRATNISSGNFVLGIENSGLSPTCEPISNTSVCAPFINHLISVPYCPNSCSSAQCQKLELEKNLYVSVLPQIWSVLTSPSCRASIGRLMCGTAYSRCGPTKQLLCSEACNITAACSSEEQTIFNRLLLLLNTTSDSLCSSPPCSTPSALPSSPLQGLENSLPQSTTKATPAVSYPTCARYDGKACAGLVNYDVYVPDKNTLFTMEQTFQQQVWFTFGLANRGACYKAFTQMVCATVFNRCDRTAMDAVLPPGSVPVPLPRLPCRSMCEAYNRSCAAFVALAPAVLSRDCSGRDETAVACDNTTKGKYITSKTGREFYPENQTVLQNEIKLNTYCNDLTEIGLSIEAAYECPYPLLIPDDETSETVNQGHCAIPCDSKFKIPWATDGWNQFFSACLVLSFLSSFATVVTYLVFRERLLRTQTQLYAFHAVLSVFVASLIPLPVVFVNPSTAISYATCIDNTREMTIYDSYCAITGILMIFTTITTGFFFTAFVVDLYLVVSMRNSKLTPEFRAKMAKWTFIGIYGYAAAFTIMSVAVKKIRHNNLPFCFVFDWVSDMFWIVMCGSLIVDCLLFFAVCRIIFISYRQTAMTVSKDTKTRSLASQYRRPIIFTAGCCLLFCIAIVARLQARIRGDEYKAKANDWFLCTLIRSRISGEKCSQYPAGIQHSFLFVTQMVIFLQGLIISSIFGFSTQNFKLWKSFCLTRVFSKIRCLAGFAVREHSSQLNDSSMHDSSSVRSINVGNGHNRSLSNRSAKSLRDLARLQSGVPMVETPHSVTLSSANASASFSSSSALGGIIPLAGASSEASKGATSPTPPDSPREMEVVGDEDSPKTPTPKTTIRKVKKSKSLSKALFVPSSKKTEFVPFD